MILHKKDCNKSFAHRSQYLDPINRAFEKKFEDLAHLKAGRPNMQVLFTQTMIIVFIE